VAQNDAQPGKTAAKVDKTPKSTAPNFGAHMTYMSSAFDTAAWLAAA
jgi:hypothetical protein